MYEGVWKQEDEEGIDFFSILQFQKIMISHHPTVLYARTHRQHTIHLYLTIVVTPILHMSVDLSQKTLQKKHVSPGPRLMHTWLDLLSLNFFACHLHMLRQKTIISCQISWLSLSRDSHTLKGVQVFIFSNYRGLFSSFISPNLGVLYQTMFFSKLATFNIRKLHVKVPSLF